MKTEKAEPKIVRISARRIIGTMPSGEERIVSELLHFDDGSERFEFFGIDNDNCIVHRYWEKFPFVMIPVGRGDTC